MQDKTNGMAGGGVERLVESLELITARLLDMTVANNQLAASQTPEMRGLFDQWLGCLTDEIIRTVEEREGKLNLAELAQTLGLSGSSALSLLLALERQGKIDITEISACRGSGRNREICDCMLP